MVLRKCLRDAREKTATVTEFFFFNSCQDGTNASTSSGIMVGKGVGGNNDASLEYMSCI